MQDTPSKVGNYAIRFGVTSKAGQSSTLCWSDSHIWDIRLVDGESHNKCSLSAILLDIPDEVRLAIHPFPLKRCSTKTDD